MMKAVVCRAWGPPETLALEEIPNPEVGATSVKIRVARAGVNFPDVLIVQGKYQVKPAFPFIPGAEVSGTIVEIGEHVCDFAIGDRVMAVCETGGFAQYVAVRDASAFKIPESMSFDTAAAMPLTYGTTIHALVDRAALTPGETLLVTGAGGGVGIAAVQLGVALGATVIAAAGSAAKLHAAREAGAAYTVDYTTESLADRVREITNKRGVDVVYDAVGGDIFDACVRAIGWAGRLLIVGFAAGRIPEIATNRLLLKSASALGVYWGAFAARDPAKNRENFERLQALYLEAKIDPKIGATYAFDEASQAIADLMNRKIIGKAIVKIDDAREHANPA